MSSMGYKPALSGSFADKAKMQTLQARRATPDSEALASSDDEHGQPSRAAPAHPFATARRPSQGWMKDIQPTRKFSLPAGSLTGGSNPTTPLTEQQAQGRTGASFPWNPSLFSNAPTARRNSSAHLKEVLQSPTSVDPLSDRFSDKPLSSPTEDPIGFLINQDVPRKSTRSQSYSAVQHDQDIGHAFPGSNQFQPRLRNNSAALTLRHRPSKPSLLSETTTGLTQLREDDLDEVESSNGSEQGIKLPAGYWEQQQKATERALLKQAVVDNARSRHRQSPLAQLRRKTTPALHNMPLTESDFAIEELEDQEPVYEDDRLSLIRRYSEHVSGRRRDTMDDHIAENSRLTRQWTTSPSLNYTMDSQSRRHSFASYPQRGSSFGPTTLAGTYEEDEGATAAGPSNSPQPMVEFDNNAYFSGRVAHQRELNASTISAAHPDPIMQHMNPMTQNPYAVPPVISRTGRRLFVVTFKCARADVYYLHENTGLELNIGDLVIVEGDRGIDLGQVSHCDVTLEQAKKYKKQANEAHFHLLLMFSLYSAAGKEADAGMKGALARAHGLTPGVTPDVTNSVMYHVLEPEIKPRAIKRVAQRHEVESLKDKEGREAKAKRAGAQKAAEMGFPMEILDAEYQADDHKLTYYYYAETYVNFNLLVAELFKQFKVRIWMSAVNPASVFNPANVMQLPPAAIGPGAILPTEAPSSSLAIGPGFGAGSGAGAGAGAGAGSGRRYRAHEARSRPQDGGYPSHEAYGPTRASGPSSMQPMTAYDESNYYAFANQLPAYCTAPSSTQYSMVAPWTNAYQQQHQPQVSAAYNPYQGGYPAGTYPTPMPTVTSGASAMGYDAYYPPTSDAYYPPASSGYGGYPATTAYADPNLMYAFNNMNFGSGN